MNKPINIKTRDVKVEVMPFFEPGQSRREQADVCEVTWVKSYKEGAGFATAGLAVAMLKARDADYKFGFGDLLDPAMVRVFEKVQDGHTIRKLKFVDVPIEASYEQMLQAEALRSEQAADVVHTLGETLDPVNSLMAVFELIPRADR